MPFVQNTFKSKSIQRNTFLFVTYLLVCIILAIAAFSYSIAWFIGVALFISISSMPFTEYLYTKKGALVEHNI